MFGPWDAGGASYGPLFVIEHWLVLTWPRVFSEYFFALLNVPLVLVAFVLVTRAARLGPFATLLAAAAWLCFRWTSYSFSVSANPEIAELALLGLAWYAASRHRVPLGAVAVACAAMIKRIPAFFLPVVFISDGTRRSTIIGVAVTAAATVGVLVIVGLGQGTNPVDVAWKTLFAANVTDVLAQPFPYPSQFLGFSNAMARLFARPLDDWSLPFFQGYYYVVLFATVAFAYYIAYRLLRGRDHVDRDLAVSLTYGIFFALLPLAAVNTHPHTFIFLLPTFTAGIALVARDSDALRRGLLATLAVVSYLFIGFPAALTPVDRVLHTRISDATLFQDPIWLNLLLLLGLFGYATALLHRSTETRLQPRSSAMAAEPG
jgi:hypothetical protein